MSVLFASLVIAVAGTWNTVVEETSASVEESRTAVMSAVSEPVYAVVYAQAKQLVREWTSDDVKKALEPESLSLAADGWRDAVSSAYRSMSRRFGTGKSLDNEDEVVAA